MYFQFSKKDLIYCLICDFQILHATSNNKNAFKALIAAEYSDVKVELTKDFQMGVSNKTPEFLKMNPIGKVTYFSVSEEEICNCLVFFVLLCYLGGFS